MTKADSISDYLVVIRSNGKNLTDPPKEILENAGQIGNDCIGRDECKLRVETNSLIENEALFKWWNDNKDSSGTATAVVYITEPAAGFAGDPEAKQKISDEVEVEVFKSGAKEFGIYVRLFSDPDGDLPADLGAKAVQVPETGNVIDIKPKLPDAVAALFNAVKVTSDGIVALSSGKSVTFNSSRSSLSFSNDFINGSVSSDDPIIGAAVGMPTFSLMSSTLQSASVDFFRSGNGVLTLSNGSDIYLRGDVNSLSYDPAQNIFTGQIYNLALGGVDPTSPFYDPSLANVSSPFLQALDNVLNPGSSQYDPFGVPIIQYQPNFDFFAQTNGFTTSAESPIVNYLQIQETPEPASILLVASGLAICVLRRLVNSRFPHIEQCFPRFSYATKAHLRRRAKTQALSNQSLSLIGRRL
jgi:hypothetical protein